MCRIFVDYNSPLSNRDMKEHLEFLVKDNGGDGCGFMYGIKNAAELYAIKNKDWNNPQFMVNTIFKFRNEATTPIVLHLRKASAGTVVDSLNNHPISLDRGTKWSLGDENTYSAYASSFLIHNGTVPDDKIRRWRRELILSGVFTIDEIRNTLTDTKILAAIVSGFGHRMLSENYSHYGLIMTMDSSGSIKIVKTGLRDLYTVVWNKNSWFITSNLSLDFAKELSKEAIVAEIPSIFCDFNYVLNTIEERALDDSRLNREFKSSKNVSVGSYNYSYNNNSRNHQGNHSTNKSKGSGNNGGKNNKENFGGGKVNSMLKAKRFIVSETGTIEVYETA